MKILGYNITREKRAAEQAPTTTVTTVGNIPFASLFSDRSAMSISTVYRCVELISDAVAMLPMEIKDGDNKVIVAHPLADAFAHPDNLLTRPLLLKMLVQSVMMKGNGFAYVHRNGDGTPKRIQFVPADKVQIVFDEAKQKLYYTCPTISTKHIEPINMLHLRKYSLDGINGLSVINAANKSIELAKNTETAASKLYEKGCKVDGIIKGGMTADQRKDAKEAFLGSIESGIAVLPPSMDYQSISLSAQDAQIIESRQFNSKDIARFFGVSPSMLGDLSGGYYGSIEAEQSAFILHTLNPYLVMMEAEFAAKLLTGKNKGQRVDFDETYLLRADKNATANYYSRLVTNGIISRNEARRELGYGEVEGGDALQVAFTDIKQNTIGNADNDNNDNNDK